MLGQQATGGETASEGFCCSPNRITCYEIYIIIGLPVKLLKSVWQVKDTVLQARIPSLQS
jgi:hypothetical protein